MLSEKPKTKDKRRTIYNLEKRKRKRISVCRKEMQENLNIVDMFGTRYVRLFGVWWSTDWEKFLYFKRCNPNGVVMIANLSDFTVRLVCMWEERSDQKDFNYGIKIGRTVWFDPATQRDMFSRDRHREGEIYVANAKEDLKLCEKIHSQK